MELREVRRQALAKLLGRVRDGIALSEHLDAEHGPAMFREACGRELEGIVPKHRDRAYRSGKCPDWVK
jgi:bifunctional non-homologous end joining protein LigD